MVFGLHIVRGKSVADASGLQTVCEKKSRSCGMHIASFKDGCIELLHCGRTSAVRCVTTAHRTIINDPLYMCYQQNSNASNRGRSIFIAPAVTVLVF